MHINVQNICISRIFKKNSLCIQAENLGYVKGTKGSPFFSVILNAKVILEFLEFGVVKGKIQTVHIMLCSHSWAKAKVKCSQMWKYRKYELFVYTLDKTT